MRKWLNFGFGEAGQTRGDWLYIHLGAAIATLLTVGTLILAIAGAIYVIAH